MTILRSLGPLTTCDLPYRNVQPQLLMHQGRHLPVLNHNSRVDSRRKALYCEKIAESHVPGVSGLSLRSLSQQ
jgi:hypothetical protein